MYVIMVYDVGEERVNRVLRVGRKYLNWVQNSVLEGEITFAKFAALKAEVSEMIDEEEDSVKFYILRTTRYLKIETLGVEKGDLDKFI